MMISVVIPAYNEGLQAASTIKTLCSALDSQVEILVVVDSAEDKTIESLHSVREELKDLSILINDYGPGPANALRFGIHQSRGDVIVVFMSDGCDDPRQVEPLAALVRRGVAIAAASRYAPGGQQVGGPRAKRLLSKVAGLSFKAITGVGTSDATNSFKAYNREFLNGVEIESRDGFELGIELVAKARRLRKPVAEIPTTWIDRAEGQSNFKILKWIPKYLRWYLYGIGFGKTRTGWRGK